MEPKSLLWTLVLAMAPVSELRGAIPYGLAHDIPLGLLLPLCVAANLLPVPLIVLFLRKILAWMQRLGGKPKALAEWLIARGFKKTMMVKKYETLGLFLLVAIPLPGTGAWTGSAIATLFEMNRLKAALAILLGNITAVGIMTAMACGLFSII